MDGNIKRISQVVQKNITADGPFAPLQEFSLSKSDALFGPDMIIKAFAEVEGQNGPYMHIMVAQADGNGPVKGDFVITTGARAIMDKLNAAGLDAMPVLAAFKKGQGHSGRTWYDMD